MTRGCKVVERKCEGLVGEEWEVCWEQFIAPYTDPESRLFDFLKDECEYGDL